MSEDDLVDGVKESINSFTCPDQKKWRMEIKCATGKPKNLGFDFQNILTRS